MRADEDLRKTLKHLREIHPVEIGGRAGEVADLIEENLKLRVHLRKCRKIFSAMMTGEFKKEIDSYLE